MKMANTNTHTDTHPHTCFQFVVNQRRWAEQQKCLMTIRRERPAWVEEATGHHASQDQIRPVSGSKAAAGSLVVGRQEDAHKAVSPGASIHTHTNAHTHAHTNEFFDFWVYFKYIFPSSKGIVWRFTCASAFDLYICISVQEVHQNVESDLKVRRTNKDCSGFTGTLQHMCGGLKKKKTTALENV